MPVHACPCTHAMAPPHWHMLRQVVKDLAAQAGPGGAHEHTLLLVMGDHGMRDDGEHGGGTPHELDCALFALNVGQLAQARSSRCAHSSASACMAP